MIAFDGMVWRLLAAEYADKPTGIARAPEGRFHHSGQVAVYASLTPEGTEVAIRRYLNDGVKRVLVPLRLQVQRAADARGNPDASIVWQDLCKDGVLSPTWSYSDEARAEGAEALFYSSRTRPDLAHVVVFDPSCLSPAGHAQPWQPRRNCD